MKIVGIWQNMGKNATRIIIFLPHFMWAESNNSVVNCFYDGVTLACHNHVVTSVRVHRKRV